MNEQNELRLLSAVFDLDSFFHHGGDEAFFRLQIDRHKLTTFANKETFLLTYYAQNNSNICLVQ